jgi:hypothetical protein
MRLATALALTLLVASPALAQSSNREPGLRRVVPPKHSTDHLGAYNQSPFGENVVREQAIRECNDQGRRYTQHLWGNMEFDVYRSCMAQRGLRE